jgi:hypothetical protein
LTYSLVLSRKRPFLRVSLHGLPEYGDKLFSSPKKVGGPKEALLERRPASEGVVRRPDVTIGTNRWGGERRRCSAAQGIKDVNQFLRREAVILECIAYGVRESAICAVTTMAISLNLTNSPTARSLNRRRLNED